MRDAVVGDSATFGRIAIDGQRRRKRRREDRAERVVFEIHREGRAKKRFLAGFVGRGVVGCDAHGIHKSDLQRIRTARPDRQGLVRPARQESVPRPPVTIGRNVSDAETCRIVHPKLLIQHQTTTQGVRRRLDVKLLHLAGHLLLISRKIGLRRCISLASVVLRILAALGRQQQENKDCYGLISHYLRLYTRNLRHAIHEPTNPLRRFFFGRFSR